MNITEDYSDNHVLLLGTVQYMFKGINYKADVTSWGRHNIRDFFEK